MKKLLLLALVALLHISVSNAKPISVETARKIAENFKADVNGIQSNTVTTLIYEKTLSLKDNTILSGDETRSLYYIFSYGERGFIIISGDDAAHPILGYSHTSKADMNNLPENFIWWMGNYEKQLEYIIENRLTATEDIAQEWTNFIKGDKNPDKILSSVDPLIKTKWDQSPYYNDLCPWDYQENERAITGCVATAMAQIMKYWEYPKTGSGFHSYNHHKYGTLSANFGSTTYRWSSMPNSVTSSNNAVATLMYHCGVSVEMDYGTDASGAQTLNAVYALKTYFGYATSVKGEYRSNYTASQWKDLLKNELDEGRPVQYAGANQDGGHSFICDGYSSSGLFHFNWGWGGYQDGYFLIDNLNPGNDRYNSNQRAIIGIKPPGGLTPQNFDLRLYSNINMSSTEIWFGSQFSLTVDIANYGTGSFSGQYGAVVFDKNFNFVGFIEIKPNETLLPNYHYSNLLTFTSSSSTTFVPGTYYTAIFYKTEARDWTVVGDGDYSNLKQFKVYYSSSIEANSDFKITTNGGKLVQNSAATINVDIKNTGSSTFYGQFRVSLSNLDRTIAQVIQIKNEDEGLPPNYHYTYGLNFSGDITVEPGTYLLEVGYKSAGSSTWYYVGSSNYSNPVYVVVQAPSFSPDRYEDNNTVSQAYALPVSFVSNKATINTAGSNFHIGTDKDYYKINLPSGYKYTIAARLHDSYSSSNGNTYTADALFAISTNGSTWSDVYDDIMSNNVVVQNGGTVYFYVAPYFAGGIGTYLLDIAIARVLHTGVDDTEVSDLIEIYPNPASDFATIYLSQLSGEADFINILNAQGQQVSSVSVANGEKTVRLPLQGLPNGTYFIQIHSSQGILTKKMMVSK